MLETITNINLEEIKSYILDLVSKNQHITEYKLSQWIIPNIDMYDFNFNCVPGSLQINKSIEKYSIFVFYLYTHFGNFSFYIYDFNLDSEESFEIKISWDTDKNYMCSLDSSKTYPKEIKIEPKKIEYYLKAFIKCILTNNFEYDITDSILRLIQSTFIFLESE